MGMSDEQFLSMVDLGCDNFGVNERTDLVVLKGDPSGTAYRLLRRGDGGWVLTAAAGGEIWAALGTIAEASDVHDLCMARSANALVVHAPALRNCAPE